MFKEIDINKIPTNIELSLALPDRTIIAILNDAYDIQHNLKHGQVHELTFSLPYEVDRNHKLVRYPHIDKVREKYLIKAKAGYQEDWYVISNIKDDSSSNDFKNISCFLLPYELNDKSVSNYKPKVIKNENGDEIEYPVTPSFILNDLFVKTQNITQNIYLQDNSRDFWRVGYIDVNLEVERMFSIDSATMLDCIFQIAEIYNALIVWDTEKREINLYKPENIGVNRGLQFDYDKYLQSVSKEIKTDELVTRLKVEGKDEIRISNINPTGANYLEDFSFFMYPFQRDANKNVLKSSNYMSDSLCNAQLDYELKVNNSKGQFNTLISQQSSLQSQLATKKFELKDLKDALKLLQNSLDSLLSTENPTDKIKADTEAKKTEVANQQALVDAKQLEIDQIEKVDLPNINSQIQSLGSTLSLENNFTSNQLKERNKYVIEKTWSSQNHVTSQSLYDDALKKFQLMKVPQVVITISIVNFLEMVECQYDWDKLKLGDIVTIRYDKMNINFEAKIIEISINYESGDINLTIANVKELLSDEQKLIKMLYNASSTSTTVDANKYKWEETDKNRSEISRLVDILQGNIKSDIDLTLNDTVTMDNRGITVTSPSNPNEFVRITHGIITLTNDGGNTYRNAITPKGLIGDSIIGKLLLGAKLVIDASDIEGKKTFTVDSNGVTISGTSLTINDDGNGIKLNSVDGLVIVKKSTIGGVPFESTKVTLNATDGFKIETRPDNVSVFDKKFYVDTNGNINLTGNINMTGGSISWENLNKPSYTATDVGALPTSTKASDIGGLPTGWLPPTTYLTDNGAMIASTYIDKDGVWSGLIYGDKIKGDKITTESLLGDTHYIEMNRQHLKFFEVTNKVPKLSFGFNPETVNGVTTYIPSAIFGSGDLNGYNRGIIRKDSDDFSIIYKVSADTMGYIKIKNDGKVYVNGYEVITTANNVPKFG